MNSFLVQAACFFLLANGTMVSAQPASTSAASMPAPVAGQPWTNSLGVKFVPAGTDGVLFSIWDVRVKDYRIYHIPLISLLLAKAAKR